MKPFWRYAIEKPQWLAVIMAVALALLPVAVWLDLRNLSDTGLSTEARTLNGVFNDIRSYYADNIVARVQGFKGDSIAAHNYKDIPGAIPIPATLSLELGTIVGKHGENIGYRFVSDLPFVGRAPHKLDAFEKNALAEFRAKRDPDMILTSISGSVFQRQIRMAVPVVMSQPCVACHNSHPDSPKRDWKVGDVRAIQEITVHQPIASNLYSFRYLLAYLAFGGLFAVAFSSVQWRQAKHFRKMNHELEEANSFLASVSMKISKYLSPQIYKSIFSGEKDTTISTERKKLTIFFSDIKDFTEMSEHLQPEELTSLLNEYFTEMSTIAQSYGATVDKFIGDAILAFFGDPETKGAREDARICLDMAIAMQRRLVALQAEWRHRGIQKPFEVRMGINTGYCNVGNFGSLDRMDYTIVGAEANLAARLQSIAEPGGIVLSYETYALVEDSVKARALPAITLKGISRKIVPYMVEGILDPTNESPTTINEINNGLTLFLDTAKLDGESAERARQILEKAIAAVKSKGLSGETDQQPTPG
ncbi:MAG: adenylate/guanylate cyclase domain-containing protein [Rhizobiaceae bacterium]